MMLYKNNYLFFFFLFFVNCSIDNLSINKPNKNINNNFSNKGFALIYNNNLYKKKIVSSQIDERSLIIFQKNLKINTKVKITNILNNKSLIAKVGKKSQYPLFNNSVISMRIASTLDININEPYIEIIEINDKSLFIANKAKTFDEEKQVATKVPVNSISINNLKQSNIPKLKKDKKNFLYTIKIGDFYFQDTAKSMINRINVETKDVKPKILKISDKQYRVYLGPFNNIISLQKTFNDINILQFENIEIIKND
jgi:hypothetical protein